MSVHLSCLMGSVNTLIYFNCSLISFHIHGPMKAAYGLLVPQNRMRCLQKLRPECLIIGESSGLAARHTFSITSAKHTQNTA